MFSSAFPPIAKRLAVGACLLAVIALSTITAVAADSDEVERHVVRYARSVARQLDRSEPVLRRWEYAVVQEPDQSDPELQNVVRFVSRYLEKAIVDRRMRYVSPDRRSRLLNEIGFSRSDDARRLQAIRAGRMLAVDVMAFVDVARMSGSIVISTSAVEVSTGRTIFTETTSLERLPGEGEPSLAVGANPWGIGVELVTMSAPFLGWNPVHPIPGADLPTTGGASGGPQDPVYSDYGRITANDNGLRVFVRHAFSEYLSASANLGTWGLLPDAEIGIDYFERTVLAGIGNGMSLQVGAGGRVSTSDRNLLRVGLEVTGWLGAVWGGWTAPVSSYGFFSENPEETKIVDASTLVGLDVAAVVELDLSPNLAIRLGPGMTFASYVGSPIIPELQGRGTWLPALRAGALYGW